MDLLSNILSNDFLMDLVSDITTFEGKTTDINEYNRADNPRVVSARSFCVCLINRLQIQGAHKLYLRRLKEDMSNLRLLGEKESPAFMKMKNLLHVACKLYDSLDVDCSGGITWPDFSSFCIRVGLNHFQPEGLREAKLEYAQDIQKTSPLPSKHILFLDGIQRLCVLDSEAPTIRLFDKSFHLERMIHPAEHIVKRLRNKELSNLLRRPD